LPEEHGSIVCKKRSDVIVQHHRDSVDDVTRFDLDFVIVTRARGPSRGRGDCQERKKLSRNAVECDASGSSFFHHLLVQQPTYDRFAKVKLDGENTTCRRVSRRLFGPPYRWCWLAKQRYIPMSRSGDAGVRALWKRASQQRQLDAAPVPTPVPKASILIGSRFPQSGRRKSGEDFMEENKSF